MRTCFEASFPTSGQHIGYRMDQVQDMLIAYDLGFFCKLCFGILL